ncbi:MAG: class I SAM-dependent methyltransferase [Pseudomonadota bacterium]
MGKKGKKQTRAKRKLKRQNSTQSPSVASSHQPAQGEVVPIPHDPYLLERARTQWQFGDWHALTQLAQQPLEHHPDRAMLALLAAAGFMQVGDMAQARDHLRQSEAWGQKARLIRQVMISGVHNSLGRVSVLAGQPERAQRHFEGAIATGMPGSDTALLGRARIGLQQEQLHLKDFKSTDSVCSSKYENRHKPYHSLLDLNESFPNDPAILIGLAESAQRQGSYDEAIRYWQDLAALLQESMPQAYYDRLDEAYQNQKSFPLGTPEEEELRGEGDKHELLRQLHQMLKPSLYLEIGVQTGKSLLLAECEAIGIDPMPRPNIKLQKNHMLLRMTSDEFFAHHADHYLQKPPDIVFIDGMHLFEYALRDFMNVERYAGPDTIVVVDDIFPGHPAQAERERRTRAWTGDVWKLAAVLETERPDLEIVKVDVFPTGLMIVKGFGNVHASDLGRSVGSDFEDSCFHKFMGRLNSYSVDEFLNSIVE